MTIQVCSYNAVTDTATVAFDLNDHTTTYLHAKSLQIAIPPQIETRSGNMRAQGEIVAALQYQNRHISMKVMVTGASSAAVEASVAALINAVKNENLPYCLALAWPGMATYKYADVARCKYTTPTDPMEIQSRICRNITLDFECRPGLRGDRVTLQNLVMNPGFEGPAGGGVATTMPTVFSDTFANVNAYSVVSGGAPTIGPANTYVDVVHADAPLRHYRLGETSGTNAYDIGGMANTGTYVASPTLGAAGLLSGDTDGAVTLNGTTQYATIPTTGLPTGASAWTIEAWAKPSSGTGAGALCSFGDSGAAGRSVTLAQLSSGGWQVFAWGGTVVSGGTAAAGVIHHVVATFDGTSLRLYVDGALVAGPTAPGVTVNVSGTHAAIGALYNGSYGSFFGGTVDEVCIYSTALSAASITAHYNAGHTGATGTVANAMSIPAAAQVKFGSPAWGAVQTWQTRFRFVTGLTNASWYLHYTDANNFTRAWVSGTSLNLEQKVAGVTNTLATAVTLALTHEAWYWLQVTQFPSVPGGVTPWIAATLLSDNEGALGAQLATITGTTFDTATALTGQPQLAATGAPLVIGGNYPSVHTVALFGPGAWSTASSGTGTAAFGWDGSNAGAPTSTNTNPYSGGPVTSYGAARMDAAPAGTLNAQWVAGVTGSGATLIQQTTQPIASAGDVLGVSAWVKSSGVGAGCAQSLQVNEYSSSGAFLRTGSVAGASVSGPQAAWTQLAGTYTTGASCAYVALVLSAVDATSGSASGVIWWDNCQVWDQTTTAQTSMPYCELRFPNSPAQWLLSGLVGDLPTPALVALGTLWASGASPSGPWTLNYALGRRAKPTAGGRFVGGVVPSTANVGEAPALDSASYGGYAVSATSASTYWNNNCLIWSVSAGNLASNLAGTYHLWARQYTLEASQYLSSVSAQAFVQVQNANGDEGVAATWSANGNTFGGASSAWYAQDAGQVVIPPANIGALQDLTQISVAVFMSFIDSAGHAANSGKANWWALVPIDAALATGVFNWAGSPTKAAWIYYDGLAINVGGSAALNWNSGAASSGLLPSPANQLMSQGTSSSVLPNVQGSADASLTLDPTTSINGVVVNQFVGLVADTAGAMSPMPLLGEIQYAPLYLTLR